MAVTAVFSVATVFVAINLVIPSIQFCVGITAFWTASNCYLLLSVGCKMLHRKLMTDYIQFDHKLIIGYIELHL